MSICSYGCEHGGRMFFERADERKQGVKECGKEALHFFFIFFIIVQHV